MVVACRIAGRRIACRRTRRPLTCRHVPARFGDFGVSAVVMVGRAECPSSAMPRPNSACSRRRHRRCTNVYSFVWPWRFIMARSAARLRRALGRSQPVMRSPDRLRSQTSPGITEHRPNIFRAFPGISGHRRTRNDHRVPYRPSPVTPSRMARRGGIARRRIACDQARRLRDSPSPDTASGMVVACRIVRRRIVCRMARCRITYRHVPARVSDLGVPPVPTVGRAEGPSSAMPRPNSRLEPTPPAAFYEHLFFCCAVALHHGAFGGAAKADRWAARSP